ncbi:hypothetical protein Nepgr_017161 [Nepenthes gracilis]|uniref:Uncharacterized protein n=1 Tax=Nepenthes gracilis TaxID=150966 RepID=A0AAD3SNY7_NEPGR|nr:hypothetical protein Nepgr_017161 [Nepenthes gracilis]
MLEETNIEGRTNVEHEDRELIAMQKPQLNSFSASVSKHKNRRIVTWTSEEDDILREQISIHGTESWTIVASKFKDKTTRQCRRRWYTYLNSDFKMGVWSPEEDMLLLEAHKIFGNRWTEIAKVVSGRTDNAVKNRFSTLCKKRAKREALAKENNNTHIHPNNRRFIAAPLKKMRRVRIPDLMEIPNGGNILHLDMAMTKWQQRPPFAVLAPNLCHVDNLLPQHQVTTTKQFLSVRTLKILTNAWSADNKKIEGTFLKKDDPKIASLLQQAELLSSLALKVNIDNTAQSLESAWEAIKIFLNKSKGDEVPTSEITDAELQLDDIKDLMELKSGKLDNLRDLMENFKSGNEEQTSERQPNFYGSASSSKYSNGSTVLSAAAGEQIEQNQGDLCTQQEDPGVTKNQAEKPSGETGNSDGAVFSLAAAEFRSPLQVTPLFRSLAGTIPSPQFSESERHFLMKTLGVQSSTLNATTNPPQPPPCRRALVHSL